MGLGNRGRNNSLPPKHSHRREFSDRGWFHNYDDIDVAMKDWLRDYNRYRPHGSLGFKSPDGFAGKAVDHRAHLLTLIAA
jgi:transposase InsO family protein